MAKLELRGHEHVLYLEGYAQSAGPDAAGGVEIIWGNLDNCIGWGKSFYTKTSPSGLVERFRLHLQDYLASLGARAPITSSATFLGTSA